MTHEFDKQYWDQHWRDGNDGSMSASPPNPYLAAELAGLTPGTALDAGCGAGAEAIWLAAHGWRVTAVDISATALARAAARATEGGTSDRVVWVEADLSVWQPDERFDLVTTHYAHPAIPQLDFYVRVAEWVARGGTLLVVGHLTHEDDDATGQGHGHAQPEDHGVGHAEGQLPPPEASITAADVAARLGDADWRVVTADERHRTVAGEAGREVTLHDVVVRAVRR
jgi:cyclopropane fatty-acyl-phospholipid synthase-like methyltransferase